MGLISLMGMISTSKPRFVTVDGRVISGRDVRVSNGRAVHPHHGPVTHAPRHADHGGHDPEDGLEAHGGQVAWWVAQPDRLAEELEAMTSHFPGFRPIVRGGRPGWAGTINTGYGVFPVEVVHRPSMTALPEARVVGRRLERKEGHRYRRPEHLFYSGALCYASEDDYRPWDGHNAVTVVAWVAHWLAEYVYWRLSGVWPTSGLVGAPS